jgi:hypothetical protein
MEEQTVERKVGFIAGTGIGKLGHGRVLERRRRIAEFGKAINSTGSRKAVSDTLDSIERARQPASTLSRHAIPRKRRRILFDPQQESGAQIVERILRRLHVTAHRCRQRHRIERLWDDAEGAERTKAIELAGLGAGRHEYHRDVCRQRVLPQPHQGGRSVHHRHHDITQNDAGLPVDRRQQGFLTRAATSRLKARIEAKRYFNDVTHVRLVIDMKNPKQTIRRSNHGVTDLSPSAMRTRSAAFLAPSFRITRAR